MPSTILSYLHNNSFLSAQPHRICKHIVNAFKLRNIYVFETVSFLSQITVCMYIHTHTQLHVCFPFKKSSRKRFQRESNQTVHYTHTLTSTHRHAEASTQEQEFVIAYFFTTFIRTISDAGTTHAIIKSVDFYYSGVARAWYICRSYFTKFFTHLYFFHMLPATLLAKRRVFGAVLVSVLPDQST